MTSDKIQKVLNSDLLNYYEKMVIRYDHHLLGGFYLNLMKAISTADLQNLGLLNCGYPELVSAWKDHTQTGFLKRKIEAVERDWTFAIAKIGNGGLIEIHSDRGVFEIDSDPFPENLNEVIQRLEEEHCFMVVNFQPYQKRRFRFHP